MDITNSEEEMMKLRLKRYVILVKINKYNRLITYYYTIYNKTITNINKKRNNMNLYESITAFKVLISSPKILEKITIISDEYLSKKISELEEKIEGLLSESNKLRNKTIQYKEKKLKLEDENARVEGEIDIVDNNIKCYRLRRKVTK